MEQRWIECYDRVSRGEEYENTEARESGRVAGLRVDLKQH